MSDRTCTVDGCEGKFYAKGWCSRHYYRNYHTGSPLGRMKSTDPCSVEGCGVQVSAKGLCLSHYMQEHYRANRERGRETRRLHYRANEAKYKNRSKVNGAISRQMEPEKHRERNRLYRTLKPELHRASQLRRRARKADADVRWVSQAEWLKLVRRFGHCCAYCGERCFLTQDHVVPLSRGGRHAIGNLLPACQSCNASKGTKFLVEWRRYRHITRHSI